MDEFTAVIKARQFVGRVAPKSFPVAVEDYVKELGATLSRQDDMDDDEAGCSFKTGGKHFIVVNRKDSPERQRFTVCHEIAHIELGLPSEHKSFPSWSYAKRPPAEIWCDIFAAELLLPYRLFKPEVDKAVIGFDAIDEMARRFEASNTATASRFAAVAPIPCAFVISEQGKVKYASRSTSMRDGNAWIQPGVDLPRESFSARARSGAGATGAERIDADVWLSDWERGGSLLEEVRHLARWDQTLTLIWFEDEEVPLPKRELREDEEELGLEELDGQLRWPSKKRRR